MMVGSMSGAVFIVAWFLGVFGSVVIITATLRHEYQDHIDSQRQRLAKARRRQLALEAQLRRMRTINQMQNAELSVCGFDHAVYRWRDDGQLRDLEMEAVRNAW